LWMCIYAEIEKCVFIIRKVCPCVLCSKEMDVCAMIECTSVSVCLKSAACECVLDRRVRVCACVVDMWAYFR